MYVWQDHRPSSMTGPSQGSACLCCLSATWHTAESPPHPLPDHLSPAWIAEFPGLPSAHVCRCACVCTCVCLPRVLRVSIHTPHAKPLCIFSHVVFSTFRNSCRGRWEVVKCKQPCGSRAQGRSSVAPTQPQHPGSEMRWAAQRHLPGRWWETQRPASHSSLERNHLPRGQEQAPSLLLQQPVQPRVPRVQTSGPDVGAEKSSVNGTASGFLSPATYQLYSLCQIL